MLLGTTFSWEKRVLKSALKPVTLQGVGNDLQVCLGLWETSPFLTHPHKTTLPSAWASPFPGRRQAAASARVPAETLGSEQSSSSLHEA